MSKGHRYPRAKYPDRVGRYPALAFAGGGYVWDEVLEYRVWCHADDDDWYRAFVTYAGAKAFSARTRGAEEPLALVLQRQHLDEPSPGRYVHVKKQRIAEWHVEWLQRPRRTRRTISDFLSPDAPANRLDVLRGLTAAPTRPRSRRTRR